MINVAPTGQALQKLFGETADKTAHKTKFVQRESKINTRE